MQVRSVWLVGAVAVLTACGGGDRVTPQEESPGGLIIVRASAGGPLEAVNAVAYAIDPASGKPLDQRPGGPILAQAERASVTGELQLKLPDDATWSGPIQVVVTGTDIHYEDPTGERGDTLVSLPNSFQLTSFVSDYRSGSTVTVPVTLWTTLADAAAMAYAEGRTTAKSTPTPIEQALPIIDELFTTHLSGPQAWDLRAIVPMDAKVSAGSVRDVVFAALADIGLNQLARDISVTAGHQPGAVITAYQLLELLIADLSDGVFNGFEGDRQLAARGGVYELSSRTTRFDLARALGSFMDAPANATGITRQALESYAVFDNIALNRSFLYPADEDPKAFDAVPPEIQLIDALPEYVSNRELTVRVQALGHDVGIAHVRAVVHTGMGEEETFEAVPMEDYWVLTLPIGQAVSTVQIWAEDQAIPANSGRGWSPPYSIHGTIVFDASPPDINSVPRRSHRNEDGAPLQLKSNGEPRVPGELDLTNALEVDLSSSSPISIKKTYVTSSWHENEPSGTELETKNDRNLPFRQFSVSRQSEGTAPTTSFTWRFEASDNNERTVAVSEGKAIPAGVDPNNASLYDVVFSQETIPLLKTTRARTVEIKLFVTATDAAGNSTEKGPFSHTYEFVDTPLHYKVDTAYPSEGSAKSLYAYFADTTNYEEIFRPGSIFAQKGSARVGRVEVLNPWPVPVAVSQSSSSNFRFSEEWLNDTETRLDTPGMDGFIFMTYELFPASRSSTRPLDEFSCLHAFAYPCGVGNWLNSSHVRHDYGSSERLRCSSGATPPLSGFTLEMKLLHPNARYVLSESTGDDNYAKRVGGTDGAAIVPPSSQSAGRIVVFPGLPSEVFTTRTWNAKWESFRIGNQSKDRFVENAGVFYKPLATSSISCEGVDGPESGLVRHEARKWKRALLSTSSRYTGTHIEFQARPVYTNGTTTVEAGPEQSEVSVPFAVDFTHVD